MRRGFVTLKLSKGFAIAFAALAVALVGCASVAGSGIDQRSVCVYADDAGASKCAEGQLSLFSPARWGNDQLPLQVAAAYCNFDHQIIFNDGGVLCVFTGQRVQRRQGSGG